MSNKNKTCCYINKFKVPDHLKPLPVIEYDVKRKYRADYFTPKSLVELSCLTLEHSKTEQKGFKTKRKGTTKWTIFDEILANSQKIVTDSCFKLCNINDPTEAAEYLRRKAVASHTSVFNLLRSLRIVMDETTQEQRYFELKNHWEKIPAGRPRYPCVLFATPKNFKRSCQVEKYR